MLLTGLTPVSHRLSLGLLLINHASYHCSRPASRSRRGPKYLGFEVVFHSAVGVLCISSANCHDGLRMLYLTCFRTLCLLPSPEDLVAVRGVKTWPKTVQIGRRKRTALYYKAFAKTSSKIRWREGTNAIMSCRKPIGCPASLIARSDGGRTGIERCPCSDLQFCIIRVVCVRKNLCNFSGI